MCCHRDLRKKDINYTYILGNPISTFYTRYKRKIYMCSILNKYSIVVRIQIRSSYIYKCDSNARVVNCVSS